MAIMSLASLIDSTTGSALSSIGLPRGCLAWASASTAGVRARAGTASSPPGVHVRTGVGGAGTGSDSSDALGCPMCASAARPAATSGPGCPGRPSTPSIGLPLSTRPQLAAARPGGGVSVRALSTCRLSGRWNARFSAAPGAGCSCCCCPPATACHSLSTTQSVMSSAAAIALRSVCTCMPSSVRTAAPGSSSTGSKCASTDSASSIVSCPTIWLAAAPQAWRMCSVLSLGKSCRRCAYSSSASIHLSAFSKATARSQRTSRLFGCARASGSSWSSRFFIGCRSNSVSSSRASTLSVHAGRVGGCAADDGSSRRSIDCSPSRGGRLSVATTAGSGGGGPAGSFTPRRRLYARK
eukprot:Unigene6685_Nuclearia_a/m.20512 Unigene6685_Nuclearia_a/g.20512  ORF Unigene6685_Nuclearia_a/g.20512 Unigene6685_Nuclearia_a/m.20512 type:complete len:353 (+) Unigene6685_Nuclearia_a:472-1530(+)